jgi:hypothetical protein
MVIRSVDKKTFFFSPKKKIESRVQRNPILQKQRKRKHFERKKKFAVLPSIISPSRLSWKLSYLGDGQLNVSPYEVFARNLSWIRHEIV